MGKAFSRKAFEALTGTKLKKFKRLDRDGSLSDFMNESDKPVATDHTHSSNDKNSNSAGANMGPRGGDSRFDLGDRNDSFMGKGQVDSFSALTTPDSIDRGGRAVDPSALDPVGIEPAMNPPMATPIDIDKQGINSLYS
jgi:hypothetical protein